jgi:hypothetical protein
MAELVDALVSNTSGRKAVPVRPRLRVQKRKKQIFDLVLPFFCFVLVGILKYSPKDFVVLTEEEEGLQTHKPEGRVIGIQQYSCRVFNIQLVCYFLCTEKSPPAIKLYLNCRRTSTKTTYY